MQTKPKVIYVTDPMCSWCWAFSPEFGQVRERYAAAVNFELVAGVLRSGGVPLSAQQISSLGTHWQKLVDRTGQKFNPDFRPPEGFVYDTEPACRALVTMRALRPELVFDYLSALHAAFYVDHVDITAAKNLAAIAQSFDVDSAQFMQELGSDAMRAATREDCAARLELGVDGFPTLLLQTGTGTRWRWLAHGYQSADQVASALDTMLAR